MRRPSFPTPTTMIALTALFFALGGSSFAIGQATAPQPRCQQGAVRGVAVVVGEPNKGIANLSPDFTTAANVFNRRFNCNKGAVAVRRVDRGVYDVRFPNNAASVGLAGSPFDGHVSVTQNPDKSFRVVVHAKQTNQGAIVPFDAPFQLVVF